MDSEIGPLELLDLAQQVLNEQVAPQLSADHSNLVHMVGTALRMVAREWAQADRLASIQEELQGLSAERSAASATPLLLAQQIRAGVFDADPRLHAALWEETVIRTSIVRPSILSRIERRMAGMPAD